MSGVARLSTVLRIARSHRLLNGHRANHSKRWPLALPAAAKPTTPPPTTRHVLRYLATNSNNSKSTDAACELDNATYDRVCTETLDALSDYFDELTEQAAHLQGSDVAYSDGVLTVNLGKEHGTYVINRQTPNKQIWLSSPTSGPKRYDFVGSSASADSGKWVYKHTGESLHDLLQQELKEILKNELHFKNLPYSS